jgi:hypothetical protein
MTPNAPNLVSSQFCGMRTMGRDAREALRALVAGQAIFVWIIAAVSDGFLPGA